MIRRREFITLLRAAGAAWPVGAWGQQHHSKVWRIGMLETTSEAQNAGNLVAFRESLRGMGYIEHQNYVITNLSLGRCTFREVRVLGSRTASAWC